MNASSTSTTPGNVGTSTASSSLSPYGTEFMNGNNSNSSLLQQARPASSSRSNAASSSSGNANNNSANSSSNSKGPTSSSSAMTAGAEPTDHLQRLAQMTQTVGAAKAH
ncbi:hypothetical protein M3Y99_00321800 [Aphelenchoides fujianensis]|nr:hypothetical protein M3Y99_00321800 [Aphelenchoides fujianensis]